MHISKLIIPAAGIGSRFLPITKAIPKEMLPISSKPAIEYIVQEALDSNINNISIILSPEKKVIQDYFSPNKHLDTILAEQKRLDYLKPLNHIIERATFNYFIQNKPQGLANALMHAQTAIDPNEYFAVALPDDIIFGQPELLHLITQARHHQAMVIAVQEVAPEKVSSYGIVAPKQQLAHNCLEIARLVEKPSIEHAPSNLAIVGRYVFHSSLFAAISQTPASPHANEILLPETINLMIEQGQRVVAVNIQGNRFDTGTPNGWLNAITTNLS